MTSPQSPGKVSENSPKRSSGRPTSFEATFSPSHQRTRNNLVDALILSVDNSERPPGKSPSPSVISRRVDKSGSHGIGEIKLGSCHKLFLVISPF